MKKILSISILILAFCTATFAQTNQTAPCPTLEILDSLVVVNAGDIITFTATVEGIELTNLTYNWKISTGEIIRGQGTSAIEVQFPKHSIDHYDAEVEVIGFPKGCPNTENVSMTQCFFYPILVDRFSLQPTRIDKARLDNLIIQLQEDSNATAYIVERFSSNISQKTINQKLKKIQDYLFNIRKQDKPRFTFFIDSAEENSTQFWIIPAGASLPTIDD